METTIYGFGAAAMSPTSSGEYCIYCGVRTEKLREIDFPERTSALWYGECWLQMKCPKCEWWTLEFLGVLSHEDGYSENYGNAFAVFQDFPVGSAKLPIAELQQHLLRQYDARHDIHPRKLEELLRSVFTNQGFSVELTCYSKDGGIDLFLLRSPSELPVAVQAKRNAATRKIGISEVDRFLGTLVRNRLYHGIFVTTSSFTRGAMVAAHQLKSKSFLIELWDAQRLLDVLRTYSPKDSASIAWELRNDMPIIKEPVGDYGGFSFAKNAPEESSIRAWAEEITKRARE